MNLFTRPRRFGKTLNMSMLQYFFEEVRDEKGGKQPDFELAYSMLKRQIADEYMRHKFILMDERLAEQKERYLQIMREQADRELYVDALQFLSNATKKAYTLKILLRIISFSR